MIVTDSSMDIHFGIFRFYVEADEEELILSVGIPPRLAWRFADKPLVHVCMQLS